MKKIVYLYKLLCVLVLFLSAQNGKGQACSVGINITGITNGTVNFSNTSTISPGTFTAFSWGFGNSTSTVAVAGNNSVTATYTTNGVYTITLTGLSTTSCAPTVTATINMTTVCNLAPSFSIAPGNNGFVSFINTSTGTLAGTTYSWNYGDGNVGTTFNHTYTLSGVYTPTLTATNNASCFSSVSQSMTVNPCSPAITPSVTTIVNANGNVSFSNTSTNTQTNTIYNLYTTGPAPSTATQALFSGQAYMGGSYNYTANGTYSIQFSAYNANTAYCTYTMPATYVTINTYTPPCTGTVNATYTDISGGIVSFSNTSSGMPTGSTYTLQYGDGSSSINFGTHTYAANGTYTAVLTAANNITPVCVPGKTLVVVVTSICSASYSYSVYANGATEFTATASPAGASNSYTWNFGGGTTSVTTTPYMTFTFTSNGNYPILLQTYNGTCVANYSGTVTVNTISVTVPCTLTAAFTHTVRSDGYVTLASTTTGTSVNTQYTWRFGDGYITTGNPASHAYSSSSAYIVKLIAIDNGCSDSLPQSINVTGISCHAEADFSLTPSGVPQAWNLIPAYPWNISLATWHWGDGSSSNTLYASHTYSAAGNYNICLSVTVTCGDSATTCSPYSLFKPGGEAASFISVNVTAPGLTVTGIPAYDAEAFSFDIFPNPNNGAFSLKLHNAPAGRSKTEVYNLVGGLVYEDTEPGSTERSISLDGVANGVYFIRVSTGNNTYTKKIIVNR